MKCHFNCMKANYLWRICLQRKWFYFWWLLHTWQKWIYPLWKNETKKMERSKHCFQQYSLDYWWLHRNRVTFDTKVETTDYGHTKAKSQILFSPNLNPTPPKNCRNNGWIIENMDNELTVPKWVLINWQKIPKMPQNVPTQIVCQSPKIWDFHKKGFIGCP